MVSLMGLGDNSAISAAFEVAENPNTSIAAARALTSLISDLPEVSTADWHSGNRFSRAGRGSISELDHGRACNRGGAGDIHRSAFGEMVGGILLVEFIFGSRAIDRKNNLVATLRGFNRGAHGSALEGVAANDHGLDASLPQNRLQRGALELVCSTLTIPFARAGLDTRIDNIIGRRLPAVSNQAVPDDHVVCPRHIVDAFDVRNRRDT